MERESLESRGTKLGLQGSEFGTDITLGWRSEDGFRIYINRNLKVSKCVYVRYVTSRGVINPSVPKWVLVAPNGAISS